MILRNFLFLCTFFLLLTSCQEDLSKERAQLEQKEQELKEREKAIQLVEAEYTQLREMRDSLAQKQDTVLLDQRLSQIYGKWKGKIVCTESSCPDYVLGDVRIDEWVISSKGTMVTAQNINKSGTSRIYSGSFEGEDLVLTFQSPPNQEKRLNITLRFNSLSPTKLSGTRIVNVNEQCQSKFSIELTR